MWREPGCFVIKERGWCFDFTARLLTTTGRSPFCPVRLAPYVCATVVFSFPIFFFPFPQRQTRLTLLRVSLLELILPCSALGALKTVSEELKLPSLRHEHLVPVNKNKNKIKRNFWDAISHQDHVQRETERQETSLNSLPWGFPSANSWSWLRSTLKAKPSTRPHVRQRRFEKKQNKQLEKNRDRVGLDFKTHFYDCELLTGRLILQKKEEDISSQRVFSQNQNHTKCLLTTPAPKNGQEQPPQNITPNSKYTTLRHTTYKNYRHHWL